MALPETFTYEDVTNHGSFSKLKVEFGLSTCYRVDDLDWNIAGAGNSPNILSELTWTDLEIFQVNLGIRAIIGKALYMRGSFGYGWIFDGDNQDSDYAGDDRTFEFSRSNNNADDGNTFDASLGIGYQLTFGLDNFGITPIIGYSYHEQNLTITDGYQTIELVYGNTGAFPGLNSKYETEWKGPWIGLNMFIKPSEKLTILLSFEYHWADYYAEADWNLRTDFAHPKSFEHYAYGNGIVISVGGDYSLTRHWSLFMSFDYEDWSTNAGIDRLFFANGTTLESRLNEVNWESCTVLLGIAFCI